jgi:hypothetical protein
MRDHLDLPILQRWRACNIPFAFDRPVEAVYARRIGIGQEYGLAQTPDGQLMN